MILSDTIAKAIAQHHECFNGRGYPKALPGDRITKEAQLLHLADELDYAMTVVPGKPKVTPKQFFEKLLADGVSDPSKMRHDPTLVKQVLALFEKEE